MAAPPAADGAIEPSSESLDLMFHGCAYNLQVTVVRGVGSSEPALAVDLEELSTGAAWHAEFTSSYIEMVTSKTGSFKRFDVLVKMLRGALFRQSDAVFLDLLTYADLVRGRWRRAAAPCAGPPPPFHPHPGIPARPRAIT